MSIPPPTPPNPERSRPERPDPEGSTPGHGANTGPAPEPTSDDVDSKGREPENFWPPHHRPPQAESVFTRCEWCRRDWQIHRDLAGYKLACRCGTWLILPSPEVAPVALAAPENSTRALASPGTDPGPTTEERRALQARETRVLPTESAGDRRFHLIPNEADLDAAADEEFGLQLGPNVRQRRATDRLIVELGAIMLAFLGPSLVLEFGFEGAEKATYQPFASVTSALLILLISCFSLRETFLALRSTQFRFHVEATVIAAIAAVGAIAYTGLLEDVMTNAEPDQLMELFQELGLPMSIFCIGFIPAVFEELAFRGLVHHRLCTLWGKPLGFLVTAAAFALAHGVTLALPFHFGLGLYLGWLRERSESLIPGMILHFIYNSMIVVYWLEMK